MRPLNIEEVDQFITTEMAEFQSSRICKVNDLTLSKLTQKNPYLFRAKDPSDVGELINEMMAAFISSSEEKFFGDFLENLAAFVARMTLGAVKPGTHSIDLQFVENDCTYIVSIKSGPNWGNSGQHTILAKDFRSTAITIKQSRLTRTVQPVLGICYGKTATKVHPEGYIKILGQSFWTMLTGKKDFYSHIMEVVGQSAAEFREAYRAARNAKAEQLIEDFTELYCDEQGAIDWQKLIKSNSGNFDLVGEYAFLQFPVEEQAD